jgi:hypothetical protein
VIRGEVQHRRRHASDIDDIDAALLKTEGQRAAQFRPGQPPVAADRDAGLPELARARSDRAPDELTDW